jgi:hypothetical protein
MKKKILLLMMGLLIVGVNVYAAGDLIVKGHLEVGPTSFTLSKHYIDSPDKRYGLYVDVRDQGEGGYYGARYNVNVGGSSGASSGYGVDMNANLVTSGASIALLVGGNYEIRLSAPSPTAITNFVANQIRFSRTGANTANHTADTVTGILYDVAASGGSGKVTTPNYRGMYLGDNSALFNGTTHSQLWLDKITGGTTNYGIVLNGDGAGSDIVFGDAGGACRPGLYSNAGYVKALNKDCVESPVSPHDPETGEWVFYSKNVKTGKMVKVNMEKLVKAVEKLTGEKFMIETMME